MRVGYIKVLFYPVFLLFAIQVMAVPCQQGWVFGDNVASCVMTARNDDAIEPRHDVGRDVVQVYQSTPGDLNKVGERLQRMSDIKTTRGNVNRSSSLSVNTHWLRQTLLGFGGALTDAAVINLQHMPTRLRQSVLQDYFTANGLAYSMVRIPMAASDYSSHMYTYLDHAPKPGDDHVDYVRQCFALEPEDTVGKIPLIKAIERMSAAPIKLFASPWSAPAWMKLDYKVDQPLVGGNLNPQEYAAWAMYIERFLQTYHKQGVDFWGLTLQNEPSDVMNFIPSMGYAYQGQDQTHDMLMQALSPMLARNFPALKLMLGDDEIQNLDQTIVGSLQDPQTESAVAGIAFHPYYTQPDWQTSLRQLKHQYSNKFLLSSEYSYGEIGKGSYQKVGDWRSAMHYASNIIGVLNAGGSGFIDWNLVLDMEHGPDYFWVSKTQAPMIYDRSSQQVYKTPLYYVIGQFSHFIQPKSKRVAIDVSNKDVLATGFITPKHKLVLVVLNQAKQQQCVSVSIDKSRSFVTQLPPRAITTFQLQD